MAIDNFNPTIWSDLLRRYLDKVLVYGATANRDWQGDISQYGDTVNINYISDITVFDYTKNTDFASGPETLTGQQLQLVIDQAKAINFQIDDVDKAQQKPKIMGHAMERAAYALADVMDQYVASLYTDFANTIGDDVTPEVPDKTTVYGYLTDAARLLDENNVPKMGRWGIVPPWFIKMLRDSGELLSDTAVGDSVRTTGDLGTAQMGYFGTVGGFDIWMSNNVPNTTDTLYKIQFGHTWTTTFADQINDMEAYRPELRFADAVKGLQLYGAKVVHPEAGVVITANPA